MVEFSDGTKSATMGVEVLRVAVVGGGLAGISAARVLSSQFGKENVVLLEAASCLGGRIRNVHGLAPWPVEMGAEFLHGSQGSSVKNIADEMGCVLRELNFHHYYMGHERCLLSSKEAEEHPDIQLVHEIFATLNEDISKVPDMSMADYLSLKGVNSTVMQLAEAIYGNDFGCSLDKLGVNECIQEARHWTYGDTYLILDRPLLSVVGYMSKDLNSGGLDPMTVHEPKGVGSLIGKQISNVRLNWVVSNVRRLANEKLQLRSKDRIVIEADYVVLTVPVTVLQHDVITFNPALPDWKLQAAHAIGMSNVVKVLFSFCHPFWPEDLFDVVCLGSFLPEVWITEYPRPQGTDKEEASTSSHRQPLGQYVVVGFIAGDAADAISQLSEAEVFQSGLAQLDDMFGNSELSAGLSPCGLEGSSNPVDVLSVAQAENSRYYDHNGVGHHGSAQSHHFEASEKFFTKSDLLKRYPWSSEAQSCHTNPALFHFQGGMIVNWAEQGFILGGYSHPSVNAQGAREALAEPVDRIYFAGEATHPGVNPCLQAAIDTGQRAAYQVIGASKIESRL